MAYIRELPEGQRPHDLLSVPGWEDNLILLYSFSKSFCIPGHRLGAVTASPAVVEQIAKVMGGNMMRYLAQVL